MRSQNHLVYKLSQQGRAFAGQIPLPLRTLTSWNLREEVGKQKEVFPRHPSPPPPTLPAQQRFGVFILSQYHAVLDHVLLSLGLLLHQLPMLMHNSTLS